MNQLLSLPWFFSPKRGGWIWYIREGIVVLASVCLLTLLIIATQLPQHLPDSLLLYLLLVLVFAAFRGLYAACLTSLLAFFIFDFLFVPPLYSLQATKFEDVLSLIVFLSSALLTSYLASALHQQVESERRKEQEARLLYQLAQTVNRQETLEKQLSLFSRYFVDIFHSSGLLQCAFLLPDEQQNLIVVASHARPHKHPSPQILPDEQIALKQVVKHGQEITLCEAEAQEANLRESKGKEGRDSLCIRLIPLYINERVLGVLRLQLLTKDGKQEDLVWSNTSTASSPTALLFSTILEHAITIIQQEQARQERVQLQIYQQTEMLRSALVTSVSHDLRKPVTTIKAAANSALLQEAENTQRELLVAIEQEADWLDNLIENLLDMSRIEAGVLQPQKTWYALDILLQDTLVRMKATLEKREVRLTLPEELPPVEIDVVLIEQVLTNLLTNAVSYTPVGSPLEIQGVIEGGEVCIRVLDRGPGIPTSEHEHIFEKFYRISPSPTTRTHPTGLGLGLSICRGIIEAHHGRIWVEERPDGGAVFSFTIPLPCSHKERIYA